MANTIRHKRGTTTPLSANLVTGEIAINTSTGAAFTKTDAGSVVQIGGSGGGGTWGSITGTLSSQTDLDTALGLKAPLASPTFTGTVTIPSGASISGYLTTSSASSTYQTLSGMTSYLTTSTAASTYAPIASPTFTGTVTIPSGALISGYLTTATASTTYAPLASPALTGTPTAPTATSTDESTQIATTAFVHSALEGATVSATTSVLATVRNETGSTLTAGTVVYISGASGNKALVSKALATGESTSAGTYGLIQNNISNNNNGTAVIAGVISGLNTNAYADGTKLYLSPTTAGEWTSTKPSAPDHMVYIGVVTRQHATQGTIQLRISNGFEVEELHNAAISSVANNDLFVYESSTTLWKNKSFTTLGLLTDAPSDGDEYVRKDGAWAVATGGGGGGSYLPLAGGTMTGAIVFDGTSGQYISKGNFDTTRGGNYGISLVCSIGYEFNWQAGWLTTTEQTPSTTPRPLYLDSLAGTTLRVWNSSTSTGTEVTHTGITFPDSTTQTTAGIADAPSDGDEYVRKDGAWAVATGGGGGGSYLPLAGGTMTGAVNLTEINNTTNNNIEIDVYNDVGAGTHFVHSFDAMNGVFQLATNGGGLTFPDSTTQTTAGLPLTGGTMTGGIVFDAVGGQSIDKGTFDSSRYGYNGISLKCAVGFELNWQAGWLTGNQFLGTPSICPIYIDSGVGSTLCVWEGTTSTGVEISHTGITFPDLTTQTTAPLADAPSDGSNYGRKDGSWVATLPDAPSDSTQYVRQGGSWVTNSGFTIGDSPSDGNYYVRMGTTGWAQIGSGTDSIATQNYVTSQGYATTGDVSTAVSGLVSTTDARKQAVVESARAVLNDSAYIVGGTNDYYAFFMAGAFNFTVTNSQFSSSGKWFGIKNISTVVPATSISLSSGVVGMYFYLQPSAGTGLFYTEDGGTTWFESSIPIS